MKNDTDTSKKILNFNNDYMKKNKPPLVTK